MRITGNNLREIIIGTFRGLSSAASLDLGSNYIRTIRDGSFAGLHSVVDLNLNLNEITSLDDYVFRGLTSIMDLILQRNNITYISPLAFKGLDRLTTLNLKENRITKIPTRSLRVLPQLMILYLGENPISFIDRKSFKGLRSLLTLWLEGCEIRRIAKRAFSGRKIETLVLEQNQLSRLPNLGRMDQLQVLRLGGNPWVCDGGAEHMLAWLLRHDLIENIVTCVDPASRRGRNLLSFSLEELLSDDDIETDNSPSPPVISVSLDSNAIKLSPVNSTFSVHQGRNLPQPHLHSWTKKEEINQTRYFALPTEPLHPGFSGDDKSSGAVEVTTGDAAVPSSSVSMVTSDGMTTLRDGGIKIPVLVVVIAISVLVVMLLVLLVIRKVIIECNRPVTDCDLRNMEMTGKRKSSSFEQKKRNHIPTTDPRNGCRLKRQLNGKQRRPAGSNQDQVLFDDCQIVSEQTQQNGNDKFMQSSCEM